MTSAAGRPIKSLLAHSNRYWIQAILNKHATYISYASCLNQVRPWGAWRYTHLPHIIWLNNGRIYGCRISETAETIPNFGRRQKSLQRRVENRLVQAKVSWGCLDRYWSDFDRLSIETLKKENIQLREQIKLLQALTDAKMTILKGNKITSAEEQRGSLNFPDLWFIFKFMQRLIKRRSRRSWRRLKSLTNRSPARRMKLIPSARN